MKKDYYALRVVSFFVTVAVPLFILGLFLDHSDNKDIILFIAGVCILVGYMMSVNSERNDARGNPCGTTDIEYGVIFKLQKISEGIETTYSGTEKKFFIYHLRDEKKKQTYFWMSVNLYPDGEYFKDSRTGKLVHVEVKKNEEKKEIVIKG